MSAFRIHLGLAAFISLVVMLGLPLARRLPWRARPAAKIFLSPVLGLSVFVLVTYYWGWLAHGFSSTLALAVGVALLGTVAWIHLRDGVRDLLLPLVAALFFSQVLALPFTLPVRSFGSYSLANDTLTYVAQSQWLQDHGWRDATKPPPDRPILSQVWFSRHSATRVGAQSALAAVQAGLRAPWAHQVYPVLVLGALAAGAMVAGAAVRLLRGSAPAIAWTAPLAVGLGLNGYQFGAMHGFLPQTVGLAAGTAGLLAASAVAVQGRGRMARAALPVGVLFAAALVAYSEVTPLLAAAAVAGLAVLWWGAAPGQRRRVPALAAALLGWTITLGWLELFRLVDALRGQAVAIVGTAVPWTAAEFAAHAVGLRSGVWDGRSWLGASLDAALLLAFAALLPGWRLAFRPPAARPRELTGLVAFAAVCGLLFIWFRWFFTPPFPVGTGQTWNQFKLAGWVSLPLLAVALAALGSVRGLARVWLALVTLAFGAAGMRAGLDLGEWRLGRARQDSGVSFDPLGAVRRLARGAAAQASNGEAIWVSLPAENQRLAQQIAYFLPDRAVLADWQDDYIQPNLPRRPEPESMALAPWLITTEPLGGVPPALREGGMYLTRAPTAGVVIQGFSGTHEKESDGPNSWRWVEREATIECLAIGASTSGRRPVFRAEILPPGSQVGVPVRVEWLSGQGVRQATEQVIEPGAGAHEWEGPAITAGERKFAVRVTSGQPAAPLSAADSRRASFMLRNVAVRLDP